MKRALEQWVISSKNFKRMAEPVGPNTAISDIAYADTLAVGIDLLRKRTTFRIKLGPEEAEQFFNNYSIQKLR